MAYSTDDENNSGEGQNTDGVFRQDDMGPESGNAGFKVRNAEIREEIDEFLKTPRFDGDVCVTLTMPDTCIRKAKDKLNMAIWRVYDKYHGPGLGMFDILVALEPRIDAVKLNAMLDMNTRLVVAKEKGISISEDELEFIAKHPGNFRDKNADGDIVECPECHGTGEVDGEECSLCLGEGRVRRVVGDVPVADDDDEDMDEMDIELDIDQMESMLKEE